MKPKQFIQFIYNNNYNVTENNVGDPLPPLNLYRVVQNSVVVERIAKDYEVEGKDTNFNAFMCGLKEDFWEYDPEIISQEVLDSDYLGDEEWTSVSENGKRMWDGTGSMVKGNEKFNPYNTECDED